MPDEKIVGRSKAHHQLTGEASGVVSTIRGTATIARTLADAASRHGRRVAIRSKVGSTWVSMTYSELDVQVTALALAFIDAGLEPGDRVCILSDTRPEWTAVDFAVLRAGAVVVPIYPSSSAEDVAWVIGNSQARVLVCENEAQLAKVSTVRGQLTSLQDIYLIDDPDESTGLLTIGRLAAMGRSPGRAVVEQRSDAVTPQDAWSIVYTSGTTGPPKGCVISHGNMRALVEAVAETGLVAEDERSYLFLPLAHMFARMIQLVSVHFGATVIYFGGDMTKVIDELQEAQPTLLPSVPRIFEKIHAKAMSAAVDASSLRRAVFDWALGVGRRKARHLQDGTRPPAGLRIESTVADKLVFRRVRTLLGGNIRYCLTGAAPISEEILEFFYGAGIPLIEGYGMTESSAGISLTPLGHPRFGTVGRALPRVEIRIADDGEICVRAPNVFEGYYGNPEATAETLVDGWLHTGDLGTLDPDGYLRITGRKKDIIITAGGKNLSPANLENDLARSRWISHAVVLGDRRPFPVALITLDEETIAEFAASHGLPVRIEQLADHPEVRALIEGEIDEVNARYAQVARIKKFAILGRELSVETGELTPTLKVKRNVIARQYADVVDALYARPRSPGRAATTRGRRA